MQDAEALTMIEDGFRALFDNFIARSVEVSDADTAAQLKARAAEVMSGSHSLIYHTTIKPVAGMELNCGIAPDGDMRRLFRIFDGHVGVVGTGQGTGH